jgi:hypothetical protein
MSSLYAVVFECQAKNMDPNSPADTRGNPVKIPAHREGDLKPESKSKNGDPETGSG